MRREGGWRCAAEGLLERTISFDHPHEVDMAGG